MIATLELQQFTAASLAGEPGPQLNYLDAPEVIEAAVSRALAEATRVAEANLYTDVIVAFQGRVLALVQYDANQPELMITRFRTPAGF